MAIPAAKGELAEVEQPSPEKSGGVGAGADVGEGTDVGEGVAVSGGADVAVPGGASIEVGRVKNTLSTES